MSGFSASFTRSGLECEKCGIPFSLFLAVRDMVSIEKLSDPFSAKCPQCGHAATYPKSAIRTLGQPITVGDFAFYPIPPATLRARSFARRALSSDRI
jgi:predicted RNA-binding Zn-ribbon protein involved in translation (DUF1610 family)